MTAVSACLVTRGDVDLSDIIDSLTPHVEEILVWDNSQREDLSVYGRYALIVEAKNPLILVQDDDVLHRPAGIEEIIWQSDSGSAEYGRLVVNMPANFRHAFYQEHALVGFGACFHRDLPERAFAQFWRHPETSPLVPEAEDHFQRTCDVVFTGLTPYTMVDVPYEDLPWATAPNRMWQQPQHQDERHRMLELVRKVRDV
jgi:hypothetical protein